MEYDEIYFDERPAEASFSQEKIVAEFDEVDAYEIISTKAARCFSMCGDDEIVASQAMDASLSDEEEFMDQLEIIKNNANNLLEEGIEPPSPTSFLMSEILLNDIITHDLQISRISASADGGITFVFSRDNRALYLEIYNDGEIGYIVEDFKRRKIIDNREIELSQAIKILQDFLDSE